MWAKGIITLQMVLNTKPKSGKGSKPFAVPRTCDHRGGSNKSTTFNEVNWGDVTRKYMDIVVNCLRLKSFLTIIKKTKELAKAMMGQAGGSRAADDLMDVDSADPYDQVVDVSDDNCESWNQSLIQC